MLYQKDGLRSQTTQTHMGSQPITQIHSPVFRLGDHTVPNGFEGHILWKMVPSVKLMRQRAELGSAIISKAKQGCHRPATGPLPPFSTSVRSKTVLIVSGLVGFEWEEKSFQLAKLHGHQFVRSKVLTHISPIILLCLTSQSLPAPNNEIHCGLQSADKIKRHRCLLITMWPTHNRSDTCSPLFYFSKKVTTQSWEISSAIKTTKCLYLYHLKS